MPNTRPPATNREALEAKYARAAQVSRANYGFYLGATNDNLADIRALDPKAAPGIKVFMSVPLYRLRERAGLRGRRSTALGAYLTRRDQRVDRSRKRER